MSVDATPAIVPRHGAACLEVDALADVVLVSSPDRPVLKFFATGAAKAQGSIRPMPKHGKRLKGARFEDLVLTSDTKDLQRWRAVVRNQAVITKVQAMGSAGLRGEVWSAGAVRLLLRFDLPRPLGCKLPGRVLHATRPDVDKLVRAVLDALSGVLYHDDGQVQTVLVQKFVAAAGAPPGVEVTAWQ